MLCFVVSKSKSFVNSGKKYQEFKLRIQLRHFSEPHHVHNNVYVEVSKVFIYVTFSFAFFLLRIHNEKKFYVRIFARLQRIVIRSSHLMYISHI